MATKLFVGSLAYSVTDEDLGQLFAQVGTVVSAKVIMDRDSGRSKGFGFVEMSSDAEAQAGLDKLNGQELSGRSIVISEAKPMTDRPARPNFSRNNSR